MTISRNDILTPANAISLAGLVLSLFGATRLDEMYGIVLFAIGRLLDMLDGLVARRTHASAFGAALDATLDKIAVLAFVIAAWRFNIAAPWMLLIVMAYHSINGLANSYLVLKNHEPQALFAGKLGLSLQTIALTAYALNHVQVHANWLEASSVALFIVSLPIATRASYDYLQRAVKASRK